jgi:hypothetical protein
MILISIASLNSAEPRQVALCEQGLDLIPMGAELSDDFKADFGEINTSSEAGFLEYIQMGGNLKYTKGITYKKLLHRNYIIKQAPSIPINLFIAISPDGKIVEIIIKMKQDPEKTKELLISLYGAPNVEIYSEMNQSGYQSLDWTTPDCDLFLSGASNDFLFYYPRNNLLNNF